MNERIRELCKHAGFIGEGFQNTVIGTCQETALENLAELIVRECANIAYEVGLHRQTKHEILRRFGLELPDEN